MNVTKNLWLNPLEISSMFVGDSWGTCPTLTIIMKNGHKFVIEHKPSYFDGDDIYKIKQNIEEVIKGNENVLLENHNK